MERSAPSPPEPRRSGRPEAPLQRGGRALVTLRAGYGGARLPAAELHSGGRRILRRAAEPRCPPPQVGTCHRAVRRPVPRRQLAGGPVRDQALRRAGRVGGIRARQAAARRVREERGLRPAAALPRALLREAGTQPVLPPSNAV